MYQNHEYQEYQENEDDNKMKTTPTPTPLTPFPHQNSNHFKSKFKSFLSNLFREENQQFALVSVVCCVVLCVCCLSLTHSLTNH